MFKCCLFGATGKRKRSLCLSGHSGFLLMLEWIIALQKRYILAKPARDAAAKAKMEAEASAAAADVPLHVDNEWNIRYNTTLEKGLVHVT